MVLTSFFLNPKICESISSQTVRGIDKRFFPLNQKRPKFVNRVVLMFPALSDMPKITGFRKNTEYFRHHNQWSENVKPAISVIWDYLTRSMLLGIMK